MRPRSHSVPDLSKNERRNLFKAFYEDPQSSCLKFSLRPATFKDEEQALRLLRELAISEGKSISEIPIVEKKFIEHAYVKKYFNLHVVEYQNKIVAVALYFFMTSPFDFKKKILFLNDLYVTPEYRGQGVGTALFEEMSSIAKKDNCSHVKWELECENKKAQAFYSKMKSFTIEKSSIGCLLLRSELISLLKPLSQSNETSLDITIIDEKMTNEHTYHFTAKCGEKMVGYIVAYNFYSTSKGYPVLYINDFLIKANKGKINEIAKRLLIRVSQKAMGPNQETKEPTYGRLQLRILASSGLKALFEEIGGEFYTDYSIAQIEV